MDGKTFGALMLGVAMGLLINLAIIIFLTNLARNDIAKQMVCIEAKAKGYQLEQCEGAKT